MDYVDEGVKDILQSLFKNNQNISKSIVDPDNLNRSSKMIGPSILASNDKKERMLRRFSDLDGMTQRLIKGNDELLGMRESSYWYEISNDSIRSKFITESI